MPHVHLFRVSISKIDKEKWLFTRLVHQVALRDCAMFTESLAQFRFSCFLGIQFTDKNGKGINCYRNRSRDRAVGGEIISPLRAPRSMEAEILHAVVGMC
jgi:hypothetical protein